MASSGTQQKQQPKAGAEGAEKKEEKMEVEEVFFVLSCSVLPVQGVTPHISPKWQLLQAVIVSGASG